MSLIASSQTSDIIGHSLVGISVLLLMVFIVTKLPAQTNDDAITP